MKCLNCNKETKNPKYCNVQCQWEYKWKQTSERIAKGETITWGDSRAPAMKRYIIETRGYACEICGIEEWIGDPIVLQMDHIDGDADNNCLENLRLLCPNCHSQTETYASKNHGNGRAKRNIIRRDRYKRLGYS